MTRIYSESALKY